MRPRVASTVVSSVASFVALGACVSLGACTSDLDAPDAYTEASISAGGAGMGELGLDCGSFPTGAVGAEYDFTPAITPEDDGMRVWSAVGLPDGLEISPQSGRITGVATTEGTFTVEFSVENGSGVDTGSCDIVIREGLGVDIDLLVETVPFCLRPGGDTLLDMVVEGTGDGTPITCESPGGSGNGSRPDGISVNPETCAIEGSVNENRQGNWVFIVRGEQSGAEVWVPYCVTNESGSDYDVNIDHSGLAASGQDGTLVPIVRRYNPDADFSVGETGDPLFEVTDRPSCGASTCFFGYAFNINASPFDASSLNFDPGEILIDDAAGGPIGFSHPFSIEGDEVDDAFKDRPWTVHIALDYCLSDSNGPCSGSENIRNNGDGNVDFSVLMLPE